MEKVWNVKRIIEEIDGDELMLYVGCGVEIEDATDKRIVLFTHELKRSGAPSVLLDMSKVLLELEYTVFLVAYQSGELLEEFVELGVNVVLYNELGKDPAWLIKITEIFQEIVVNTRVLMPIVEFLCSYAKRVYWWIHEAEIGIANTAEQFYNMKKSDVLEIWAASPLIKDNIKTYWKWDSELLNFYVEDFPAPAIDNSKKINIINVGDVNGNKGQDILVSAFEKLERTIREKCNLYFCGDNQRYNKELLLKILDYVDMRENVHMLEGMSKTELYNVYDYMHIVVVASYYESTSAVAVEGLMKEKLCICTESCGVCRYLKDGENVLMFKRGDSDSLARALEKAIMHYDDLEYIRKSGRLVYENIYTKAVFKNRLKELLQK